MITNVPSGCTFSLQLVLMREQFTKKTTNKQKQKQTIPTPIVKKQHLGVHVDRPLMKYAPFKGIGTAYPSQDFSAEMAKKSDMNLFSR